MPKAFQFLQLAPSHSHPAMGVLNNFFVHTHKGTPLDRLMPANCNTWRATGRDSTTTRRRVSDRGRLGTTRLMREREWGREGGRERERDREADGQTETEREREMASVCVCVCVCLCVCVSVCLSVEQRALSTMDRTVQRPL